MANALKETFVATVVAVVPPARLDETTAALERLRTRAAVRTILISLGDTSQPEVTTAGHATTILGLVPRYLNNAVAALRLSSLPTVAWWRGGDGTPLEPLAALVDRVVLDTPDPTENWRTVAAIAKRAAVSDLRWTALTRWRNQMARFFDLREVHAQAAALESLRIVASDAHAAQLYGAWISSTLPRARPIAVTIDASAEAPVESIVLSGAGTALRLALSPTRTCIESSVGAGTETSAPRVVPLGDQSVEALVGEELRLQSRDEAFERAIREIVGR